MTRSTTPIHAIQSEDIASASPVATTAIVDIRQLDDGTIDDDLLVVICSLATANPCTCDICSTIDHMIGSCPCLQKMMSDPVHAHRIVDAMQQGCTTRGGSTTNSMASTASLTLNSMQACSRAPPTSNGSATIWQLQDDNANNYIDSAIFTDEEGSVDPDYQQAHVLALDKFMDGLLSHLQTILLMAQCQLAWMLTTQQSHLWHQALANNL